jgi:hypothetical protein
LALREDGLGELATVWSLEAYAMRVVPWGNACFLMVRYLLQEAANLGVWLLTCQVVLHIRWHLRPSLLWICHSKPSLRCA